MPPIDAEIAALQKQVSELTARLAAVEGPQKPAPKIPQEDGARVYNVPPSNPDFVRPSPTELRALFDAVSAKYPHIAPPGDDEDTARFFRKFAGAFHGLSTIARTETLNGKYYAAHWVDVLEEQARACGSSLDTNLSAILHAALAHGDILVSNWTASGVVLEFGLSEFGQGRKATSAWREVLLGKFRPLVMPQKPGTRPPRYEASNACVCSWSGPLSDMHVYSRGN